MTTIEDKTLPAQMSKLSSPIQQVRMHAEQFSIYVQFYCAKCRNKFKSMISQQFKIIFRWFQMSCIEIHNIIEASASGSLCIGKILCSWARFSALRQGSLFLGKVHCSWARFSAPEQVQTFDDATPHDVWLPLSSYFILTSLSSPATFV